MAVGGRGSVVTFFVAVVLCGQLELLCRVGCVFVAVQWEVCSQIVHNKIPHIAVIVAKYINITDVSCWFNIGQDPTPLLFFHRVEM